LVESFGVEVIEDMPETIDDQMRLFRSASLIVSSHGSALANLVWCEPGTRVLELFSSGYVYNYYYYLSQLLGLSYACVVTQSSRSNHWTNLASDIFVDLRGLEQALA
jgi:capsular polysaccharide biosynthesis protein